ncbi:MAG: hypothetical protein AB7L09_00780 [Nitrospira sp.]
MSRVKLIDYFGFVIGEPEVPGPFPRVIVWGDDFFVANDQDIESGVESPRYHMTSGLVVTDTRQTPDCR